MSICTYAFLGANTEDLERRVTKAFADIGFDIQVHPEMRLLENSPCGCLYVQLRSSPAHLKRVCPATPLLVAFEYYVEKQDKKISRKDGWPPKGVKQFNYLVSTRTSSGRSRAAFYIQALTTAVLAKETGGYFYVDVEEVAHSGSVGLDLTLKELNSESNIEFDADAYPFNGWPPKTGNEPFEWSSPIKSIVLQQMIESAKPPKRRRKLSLTWITFGLLVLYLCVMVLQSREGVHNAPIDTDAYQSRPSQR